MSALPTFEMAPAAVARVASVPLEALEALAAPQLARRALADDPTGFASEYERVLLEQRVRLWQRSSEDPRVRCGLALASPSLLRKLGPTLPSPRRNKRARHLDTSLYRYLARAAGRLEPYGLWTSVALASVDTEGASETYARPCASKCHVAPDLGPFRALLDALGQREPYRNRGPYRLDPSLQRQPSGRWCHAKRGADGALRWTTLPASNIWPLLSQCWGDGQARTQQQLLDALGPELSTGGGPVLLELARDAGLLVGGLGLPPRFASPWEALELVEAALEPGHRQAWSSVRATMKAICEGVEAALDAATNGAGPARELADRVLEGREAVHAQLEQLAAQLELDAPAPEHTLLRCDETAPFDIHLGTRDRERLAGVLTRWSTLERRRCSHRRWAHRAARTLAASSGRVVAAPSPIAVPSVEPADLHACEGPPLGALVIRPGREGFATPYVRGLSHAPTVTHARHAYHLAQRGDALLPWLRTSYRALERRHGVRIHDLVHVTSASPNLLARPRYVDATLDPWGSSGAGPRIDQLRLVPGPTPGAVLLEYDDARCSAHVFTALSIHPTDVIAQRLMHSSFDLREAPAQTTSERDEDATDLPRPARTRLSADELEQLLGARGARRYIVWRRLARDHAWPQWLRIQCGTRPALLMPSDSPLALEAVFEGVRIEGTAPEVVVEQMLDDAWLQGPRGRHLVEFVLPVRRTPNAWTRNPSRSITEEPRHACA